MKVYITESGRRYHSKTDQECLEKAAGTQSVDLEYAFALGLTPCQTCGAPIPPNTSEGDLRWLRHIDDWAKSGRFETRQEQAFASQVLAKVRNLNPDDVQPQMIIKVREQPERVDFYISRSSLVLEVDGFAKDGAPPSVVDLERRNARDAALQSGGYIVLHFSNAEVQQEPQACVNRIEAALTGRHDKSQLRLPSSPHRQKRSHRTLVIASIAAAAILVGSFLALAATRNSNQSPTMDNVNPSPASDPVTPSGKRFANCAEAREAGITPIRQGSVAYLSNSHLDGDGDGIACE